MKKIYIVAPMETELQKRAVERLTEIFLDYTFEYPICVTPDMHIDVSSGIPIYVGTKKSNRCIADNSAEELMLAEEYSITVKKDTVTIEGFDDAGALYGAIDLYNKYVLRYEYPNSDEYRVNFFEKENIPDFYCRSAPAIKERGLWTWGHVIYDYKGYIDNMMRLKLNSVIIWNDNVPVNAKDIIEYAHSRNIKVIWGFAWLWDTDCARFDLNSVFEESGKIFDRFETEFGGLDVDGIYFQTFTELDRDSINGVLIADAAASFVNRTAMLFYEKYPKLELQFGLHANSVRNKLEFIKNVDKRIKIVWENLGSFPFSYMPTDIGNFDVTMELVRKLVALRGEDELFGVVTKGLVKLDWSTFKHSDGAHCIGISTERMKEDRIRRKAPIWRYIQSGWLANADKAYDTVRLMSRLKNRELSVFALVEDGMFERNIMYPVALLSEMLWSCDAELNDIIRYTALREYVTFA